MSLAGVDPTAEVGIPGNATNVQQVEPVIERVESRSSKQEDLAHTNMKLGLDVIFRQFVYMGTWRWTTSDAPGKVLATFPIHPSSCNEFNDHIYKMMNNWVGGMKMRFRVIGTAFFGGGLYFVRIPPTFSLNDIHAMNLAGFTAFPHVDTDPKNLSSIDLDLQDYRQNHFHTGELDLTKPESFGGWLVVVVNARLVTQSSDINAIDFRVESAGNFTFQVPRPIRTTTTESTGPLSQKSLKIGNLRGCDDAVTANSGTTTLHIMKSSFNKILNGHVFTRRAGGAYTFDRGNAVLYSGTPEIREQWWKVIEEARRAKDNGSCKMLGSMVWIAYNDGSQAVWCHRDQLPLPQNDPEKSRFNWFGINFTTKVSHTSGWDHGSDNDGKTTYGIITGANFFANETSMSVTLDSAIKINGVILWDGSIWHKDDRNTTLSDLWPFLVPGRSDPRSPNKSLVCVVTNHTNSVSAQPEEWAEDLAQFKSWPTGSAALYKVLDGGDNVLTYIQLHEDGLAFAPPSATEVTLGPECRLEFDQWVSEGSPVPIAEATTSLYVGAAMQRMQRKVAKKLAKI